MDDLLTLLQNMALKGYGVVWNDKYHEYRPFSTEDYGNPRLIRWWHEPPSGCGSVDFETAVRATNEEMLRQLGP